MRPPAMTTAGRAIGGVAHSPRRLSKLFDQPAFSLLFLRNDSDVSHDRRKALFLARASVPPAKRRRRGPSVSLARARVLVPKLAPSRSGVILETLCVSGALNLRWPMRARSVLKED